LLLLVERLMTGHVPPADELEALAQRLRHWENVQQQAFDSGADVAARGAAKDNLESDQMIDEGSNKWDDSHPYTHDLLDESKLSPLDVSAVCILVEIPVNSKDSQPWVCRIKLGDVASCHSFCQLVCAPPVSCHQANFRVRRSQQSTASFVH
jgi:hypothetical protein